MDEHGGVGAQGSRRPPRRCAQRHTRSRGAVCPLDGGKDGDLGGGETGAEVKQVRETGVGEGRGLARG